MLPAFSPYVLPVSVLILVALFAIQPQGTARIGRAFGPIMALWFLTIALLGIWGIARYPSVLVAIDPRHAISYLLSGGATGFLVLGGVFYASPVPRRSTRTWATSAPGRSGLLGPSLFSQASF
jgi:KUP system potassium uptake protein